MKWTLPSYRLTLLLNSPISSNCCFGLRRSWIRERLVWVSWSHYYSSVPWKTWNIYKSVLEGVTKRLKSSAYRLHVTVVSDGNCIWWMIEHCMHVPCVPTSMFQPSDLIKFIYRFQTFIVEQDFIQTGQLDGNLFISVFNTMWSIKQWSYLFFFFQVCFPHMTNISEGIISDPWRCSVISISKTSFSWTHHHHITPSCYYQDCHTLFIVFTIKTVFFLMSFFITVMLANCKYYCWCHLCPTLKDV